MSKSRNTSIQTKMIMSVLAANLLIFIVNVVLLKGIDNMSDRMDEVYQENLFLNELTEDLDGLQNSMTEYLNVKTSDALEEFYKAEQQYRNDCDELQETIADEMSVRMERNIKKMSENYLEAANLTIEAKRGRNVEKYRMGYEKASEIYDFITATIYSLNNEQFQKNSRNYSEMLATFRKFEMTVTIVMLAVILCNIVLITRLTFKLLSPLQKLKNAAQTVATGNFEIEPIPVSAEDEIGVVTKTFNKMVVSIQEYIEQIKQSMENERALKEKELTITADLKDAQLKYLQAQINPHFLFNTLNAGAQLAMMEGADRTYEYVQHMADFFRYNVKKSSQEVTLGEELTLIDNYIYILNVRFAGDIGYEKDIDEALLNTPMPGMILQPIVENCVNHGIREMMGSGIIRLKVFESEGSVCVSVSDNGKGMSHEMIERILSGEQIIRDGSHDSNGIGLVNCIARLRYFTGNENPMDIVSGGENEGTAFIITLNKQE